MDTETRPSLAELASLLESAPEYRVLRMFRPRESYGVVTDRAIGLFVDVEATGLNTDEDVVIQFAALRFEYDRTTGEVGRILSSCAMLEDPGRPLDPKVVEITGLTDEKLRGHQIDEGWVAAVLSDVELAIAHNADFDRKMIERRFPGLPFDAIPWACSQRDVPWERFGCQYIGLEYLLMKSCGEFFLPHDALDDCRVGLHVLAAPRCSAGPERLASPFSLLLEAVREPTYRLWAWQSPMWTKDRLRLRRFRWDPDARCWRKDLTRAQLERERDWLLHNVYDDDPTWDASEATVVSRKDLYSSRA